MKIAPAARIRATWRSSASATCPANSGEPCEVGNPATLARSLTATGNPCSTPRGPPSSTARASAIRSAASRRLTIALTRGLTAAMRSNVSRITASALTSRRTIRPTKLVAVSPIISTPLFLLGKNTRTPKASPRAPACLLLLRHDLFRQIARDGKGALDPVRLALPVAAHNDLVVAHLGQTFLVVDEFHQPLRRGELVVVKLDRRALGPAIELGNPRPLAHRLDTHHQHQHVDLARQLAEPVDQFCGKAFHLDLALQPA